MKKSQALAIVGGLSNPSKMPCHGWSIPAIHCKLGALLAKQAGTVCHGCYAFKGMYVFPVVKAALQRRYDILMNALQDIDARNAFRDAFKVLLAKRTHFRWHDSGDLQSVSHLALIADIARDNEHVSFWLPTRETGIIRKYFEDGLTIPSNLCVRVSAHKLDTLPDVTLTGCGSAVSTDASGFTCPASRQDNECRDCRACWSTKVPVVTYRKH